MTWTVGTYAVYLLLAIPLTVWVASTLSRHGRVFLEDVFAGNEALAHAVNRLLVVGFYLLSLGFVLLFLRVSAPVVVLRDLVETVSVKVGVVMVVLAIAHLVNVYVFNVIRRRSRLEQTRPTPPTAGPMTGHDAGPVPPQGYLTPQQPAYPR